MSTSQSAGGKKKRAASPVFAHPSEREFARILDFYQIEWQYEPRTFELEWDDRGIPTVSFAPDFYLPELDLFIELTTLRQSLVTKKNRKLRRLRALYPDINIRLFYNRDFRSLMSKYGLSSQLAGGDQQGAGGESNASKKTPSASTETEGKLSPE